MKKFLQIIIYVGIAAAIVLPRVLELDRFQTADEKRWYANTTGFVMNLAHGDWEHLMMQSHPGITTQWLAAPNIFTDSWPERKFPLVIAQIVMIGIIGYFFWRLVNAPAAAIVSLLLGLNPVLIAHTRVLAMDSLLAQFLLLSSLAALLWRKNNQWHYLVFSGLTAAAAVLSKLPGLIICPLALFIIYKRQAGWKLNMKAAVVWLAACLVGAALILPSIIINPSLVISDIYRWLQSDDYALHQMGRWYYVRSIIFFSTPLHLVALLVWPVVWLSKKMDAKVRRMFLLFITTGIIFACLMSLSEKKGDRYILPTFVFFDAAVAVLMSWIYTRPAKSWPIIIARISMALLLILQAYQVFILHPYTLAYVNPITQVYFGERRLGWGEGLDMAADYLNEKAEATKLTVATYFPNEFANYFIGETVPIHQYNEDKVDYAVIYRAMFERGPEAWETDVLRYYGDKKPEKVIGFAGTELIWIFKNDNANQKALTK